MSRGTAVETKRESKRYVKAGEALAIDPKYLQQGPEGSFWLTGAPIKPPDIVDGVGIVYIRGPLEHHDDEASDNYDSLLTRTEATFASEETAQVVLCIDSPGGVVSGLNETVAALARMRKRHDKPLIAFVDEMATSAAYALSCACDAIFIPRSGICGSIGVISTMADQVAYDQKTGFRFETITSGERKADGHPHVAISDGAIRAETRRVQKLAKDFFRIVNKSRKIPIPDIKSFQAGIFLGSEAEGVGLVDGVMGWEELFEGLKALSTDPILSSGSKEKTLAHSNQTGSSLTRSKLTRVESTLETNMPIALSILLKRQEAQLAAETDPKKRKALSAEIAATKKVKHTLEKYEEESDDEEEEEDEEKGNETDRKEKDDDSSGDVSDKDDDDDEDDDEDDEEDDEDEDEEDDEEEAAAKAMTVALRHLTGKKTPSAILGAIQSAVAKANEFDRVSLDVRQLKKKEQARELDALVKDGIARGQFRSPRHAAALRKEGLKVLKAYLSATPRGTFLTTTDSIHVMPDGKIREKREVSDTEIEGIPVTEDILKAAKMANAANPRVPVETFVKEMRKAEASRMNGKGTY